MNRYACSVLIKGSVTPHDLIGSIAADSSADIIAFKHIDPVDAQDISSAHGSYPVVFIGI